MQERTEDLRGLMDGVYPVFGSLSGSGAPPEAYVQACRNCGQPFPYDPEADRCPACASVALGESGLDGSDWHDCAVKSGW
jgi:rubrerythrin